jgi:hypothetical protein
MYSLYIPEVHKRSHAVMIQERTPRMDETNPGGCQAWKNEDERSEENARGREIADT